MSIDYKEEKKQFKRAKKGSWAIIPKQVWLECSHSQLCVYSAISYLQGNNDYTWAGMDIISRESGYSTSACDKIIRELIKLGWIGRIKQYGKPSKLFVYMDYMATEETKKEILDAKKKAKLEFTAKMKELKDRKKLTNLQNQNDKDLQNQNGTNLQNLSGSIYQQQLPTTITNKKAGEEKKSNVNNHEGKEIEHITENSPTQVQIEIPPEVQKDIEENERLLAIHRQQKEITALPQSPVYTSSQLLGKSEEFIQKIGFGFTKNPRNILDAIYKQLPEDYQTKEDPKDIELVRSAINQYESSPPSERDALAKKFYGTVENMAKLYLIKKYGEEFRDKLYPEILNKNLIMYLNCNPTFKYCHGGFSNDIDGVYAEITRIVRKKTEKREQEAQREEEKRIERERVRELMVNRPHYSDEEIHAMGLKTTSEILESSRNKGSQIDLLDEKYTPIAPLSDRDRLREEELLRMAMSGQRLNGEEQAEFDYLRRKKAMGIV
jgi:hypothetical protein